MKTFNFLRSVLIVIILITAGFGCEKDDSLYTGKVQITFANHPSDLRVNIFPIENMNKVIFDNLKPDGKGVLTKELNMGNYIIAPISLTVYYGNAGFQVQAGKTTKISFDGNNMVHIQ